MSSQSTPFTLSSSLKSLMLLLLAALALAAAPQAHAFDRKKAWDDATVILHQLQTRLDRVDHWHERLGAGPHLQEDIDQLHAGVRDLYDRIQNRKDDPKNAVSLGHSLTDLMDSVDAKYRERAARLGVFLER